MSQAADADHPNPIGGFHVELDDGIKDGDAAAKQQAGFFTSGPGGNSAAHSALQRTLSGEPAKTADDGLLVAGAEIVIAAHALV
ncbi:MAG: hypothetical protein IPP10_16295 [Candidatus Competibacteraceae bacterium]|nr:hypothetical protein [Candidatus Competibacteraceae bacterium]